MARMIRVEPLSLEWIEALAEGDGTFTERFGIPVVAEWLAFPEALPYMLETVRASGASAWGSHLFFHEGALVGFGGWKGAPVEGAAELGYAVAPERRGRGIATAVVRVLVERGRDAGLTTVLAHTLAETNASTRVLERCGFTKTADVDDPEDGALWRWELSVRAS